MNTYFRTHRPRLGAIVDDDGTLFRVWAPEHDAVSVTFEDRRFPSAPMEKTTNGLFERYVPNVGDGMRYRFRLGEDHVFPDPASRFQPKGVHGPSMVVDPRLYAWHDSEWHGIALEDLIFYELHVGAFTPEGSYAGVHRRLDHLKTLGITAIELMPVADFPGRWNWGYDHAALYAPSRAYGTPEQLRKLVDAAHQAGLAVYLDVIHNHLGPDGAYVAAFAPILTDKRQTPWGKAINLDDTHAEGVRHFFIDNALYWLREFHIDGFRLDAIHRLYDESEVHFLQEFAAAVHGFEERPQRKVIAEDHNNINTLVLPPEKGGYGLDGTWSDDFNHQIRTFTAGTVGGIFTDFEDATAKHIAEGLEKGWYYDGKPSPSRKQDRGTDASEVRPEQIVIYIQNHDQVGNRPHGERLHHEIDLSVYRAASAVLLFAYQTPLLFMGQEWAASTPFQFFTDHHGELGEQVRKGRARDQRIVAAATGPGPNPQDADTFCRSRLRWDELQQHRHARMFALYRDLLSLRKNLSGPLSAVAHGTAGFVLRRGAHTLLAALENNCTLPYPEDANLLWHTEEKTYAPDGVAPKVTEAEVYFPVAAAMILRSD